MARRSDHTRPELKALALEAAREIIAEDGVGALSTRKLANRIGYTSGTIYQVFRNRDDLIEQVNAETLARLHGHCREAVDAGSVEDRLRALAEGFVGFARAHPGEWDAVISYPFAPEHQLSDAYYARIGALLDLLCAAIGELYGPDGEDRKQRDARLLWNGLYGIFALSVAGRLDETRGVTGAVNDLIGLYLDARG